MRRLRCPCGGEIGDPPPSHCPHCGARIRGVRQRTNWFGPVLVVLLLLGLVAVLFYLAGSF